MLILCRGFQYSAIADDIRDVASKDPAHRKLFVRGLAWETSSEALRDAFKVHGEIEEGAVIVDKNTGKSRGYGFITYKHMDSARKALAEPSKIIDGRIAVCNLAVTGMQPPPAASDLTQRKLFIGSLSYETTTETLINIFSQYGEIEEGSVAYDKATNKSRGFGFMTFKTVEAAKRALADSNKIIEGRNVVIKLAAEGLKEKAAQIGSQIPSSYVGNSETAAYSRPSMQAASGISGYASNFSNYANQPYAQYGGGAGSTGGQYGSTGGQYSSTGGQYGSTPYTQYTGGYASSQGAQSGSLASSTYAAMPGYYGAPT
ncbi:hypothetical protein KP509_28G013300 [Ceratopteris richardii]|uniref:RRM domain-containing protein n=1 Tax=Ceratopteris richardii TaxID=49495 RepID=A0A8T2RBI2_CERRI|nr:hypothetical protein KP509_28G013300 [Ceratopteris richardii]